MSQPQPYEFDEDETFDEETDFLEVVADQSPSVSAFSVEQQEATRTGYVAFEKVASAVSYFCGFDTRDDGAPYRIRRSNPAAHPRFPWLFAQAVAETPIVAKPNPDNDDSKPYVVTPFLDAPIRYSSFTMALLTVRYRNLRWAVRPDEDIDTPADEFLRNTFFDGDGSLEVLSADGQSQLIWAETGTGGPTVGERVPSAQTTLLGKQRVLMTWVAPWDYVSSDPDVPNLKNFQAINGTINSQGMLAEFPGVMLCKGYSFDVVYYPVMPNDPNKPLKGFKIKVEWEIFDPPRGATTPATRGHLLMPWRTTGQFYLATRDGTTTGKGIIPTTDHTKIFYAWDDPSAP